jgi:hypothetical protein
MKLYNAAIEPLATKYSGNTIGLHVFLRDIQERAREYGWDEILTIPIMDPAGEPAIRNLIKQYGLITLADIRSHATIYENQAGRNAQNASQMYTFLYKSLSEEAKLMVLMDYHDYTLVTEDGNQVSNGPAFLKVIIRNTTVDTRSTVFHIRDNLNRLTSYIADEATYDIERFNQYVTSQMEQLSARGEVSSDLLVNVFAAYLTVPDRKFVEYVEKQKDKYDERYDGEKAHATCAHQVHGPQAGSPVAGPIARGRTNHRTHSEVQPPQEHLSEQTSHF